ncbi:hypothetical protein P154DRAFT_571962 [Amniculicola lignicola CBS 123094]|uniref:Uncharacterized protein n=1 Tax=Amniculicola lignicola CBS 123094 TaxID=1392246 RepID=A0A6A5WT50_9PLEO|nr:hypothetical protein P154DRAFT_571962 [Amniculicola lignicola CBS 123094]
MAPIPRSEAGSSRSSATIGISSAILAMLTLVVGILQLWKMHRNQRTQALIYELAGMDNEEDLGEEDEHSDGNTEGD